MFIPFFFWFCITYNINIILLFFKLNLAPINFVFIRKNKYLKYIYNFFVLLYMYPGAFCFHGKQGSGYFAGSGQGSTHCIFPGALRFGIRHPLAGTSLGVCEVDACAGGAEVVGRGGTG